MSLVDGRLDQRIDDTLTDGRRTLDSLTFRAFAFDLAPDSRVVLDVVHTNRHTQDWSVRAMVWHDGEIVPWPDGRPAISIGRAPMRLAFLGSSQTWEDEKPFLTYWGDGHWELWLWSVQGAANEFLLSVRTVENV